MKKHLRVFRSPTYPPSLILIGPLKPSENTFPKNLSEKKEKRCESNGDSTYANHQLLKI